MLFSKSPVSTEPKIVTTRVVQVQLPSGPPDEIDADHITVTEGGALVLYKTKYLGRAGCVKSVVKAYGISQWKTAQHRDVLRTS